VAAKVAAEEVEEEVEKKEKIMSIQQKLESALAVIREHNETIGGPDQEGYVNPEEFAKNVKLAGGTSESRLSGFTYEDIAEFLPTVHVIHGNTGKTMKPIGLARNIAQIWRAKEDATKLVGSKKAERMSPRELIENLDPEEDNPVYKKLAEIAKDEPFIVFNSGKTVDVETTLKLLIEIKKGYPGRQHIEVEGNVKKVYRIGELPEDHVDENPLYPNRPLRPDGTCDQTGRSWEGVSLNVRQLVRIAMKMGDIKNIDLDKANMIHDMVLQEGAFEKLKKRYPKSAIEFERLESLDELPKLRITIKVGGQSRPFDKGAKVEWHKKKIVPQDIEAAMRRFQEHDARIQPKPSPNWSYRYDANTSQWYH